MKLITKEVEKQLPPLGTLGNKSIDEITCTVKFFTPDSSWTWFILEYDPEERIAFAFVVGMECEFGLVSISELELVTGPMGLKVERDMYFQPTPLRRIVEEAKSRMFT
jgi:hypothetical protein